MLKRNLFLILISCVVLSFPALADEPASASGTVNEEEGFYSEDVLEYEDIEEDTEMEDFDEIEDQEVLPDIRSEYPEPETVTLQFETEFTFDIEEEPIYMIEIEIPTGIELEEGEEDIEVISLFRQDDFKKEVPLDVYFDSILMTADVDNDFTMLYDVEFEGLPQGMLFDDEIRNSGEIEPVTDDAVYPVKIIVSKNEDAVVTDINKAPTLSEDYEKVISGEYGESRNAEIEGIEPSDAQPEEDNGKKPLSAIYFIVAAVIILILGGGTGLVLYIRYRVNKDD